ncbi:MAG: hypothetical protein ACE5SW_11170, partial [Nitrososphaeraceae archaeon]
AGSEDGGAGSEDGGAGSEDGGAGSEDGGAGSEDGGAGSEDGGDSPDDDVIDPIKTIFDKKDDEPKHHFHTKKIIKTVNSKCLTQSNSIPLVQQIGPRNPLLVADFYPCELKEGRATLNLPNDQNLGFVVMHIDREGNENEGIMVAMDKIQSLNKNNALFIVNFDDKMEGIDPITGEEKKIKDINAMALFNTSTETIDMKPGNSLAISAVLKS